MGDGNGGSVKLALQLPAHKGMEMNLTTKFPLNFRGLLCLNLATVVGDLLLS